MIISFIKPLCLLWVMDFWESHHRLRIPSTLFGFSPSECSKAVRVFHLRECLALLVITRHMFFVSCNRETIGLRPTVPSPLIKSSISLFDLNHAPTPMKCNVPVHMQCNTPLHVMQPCDSIELRPTVLSPLINHPMW